MGYIFYSQFFYIYRLFEERCIDIMDSMYKENRSHALLVMNDTAEIWNIVSTPFVFAHENQMYDIVAHICSKKIIAISWRNYLTIHPDQFSLVTFHWYDQFDTWCQRICGNIKIPTWWTAKKCKTKSYVFPSFTATAYEWFFLRDTFYIN